MPNQKYSYLQEIPFQANISLLSSLQFLVFSIAAEIHLNCFEFGLDVNIL